MVWRAASEQYIEHPYKVCSDLIKKFPKRDDISDIVNMALKYHSTILVMDAEIRGLRADNLRLKHENEFMLRLINEQVVKA